MATDLHTAANRLLKAWDLNDLIHEHIEALRQALANEALDKMAENARELGLDYEPAQQQEPVAYGVLDEDGQIDWTCEYPFTDDPGWPDSVPLYTSPPAQRTWVGLTDEEKRQLFEREDYQGWLDYINAIEAKLRSKNEDRN